MLYIRNYDKNLARNMSKLNDFLLEKGVSPTRYAIGIGIDDKLCLDQNQDDKQWNVYYQERGSKMYHMQYVTFGAAAMSFVDRLIPIERVKKERARFNEQFVVAAINEATVKKYAKGDSQNNWKKLAASKSKTNQIGHQWGAAVSYGSISEIQCSKPKKKRLKKRNNEL